jgi:ABC-type Mn2+/Zn2+ transport system permease subunit
LIDFVLDPWRSEVGRHALAELILLGSVCGPLSFWVTSYRLSYGAESLAHGLLPGLVLAALAGAPLLGGAGAGAAVGAVLIAAAAADRRTSADTATAVVVTGLLGLGVLLALAPEAPPRLDDLLFGDLLAVSNADLVAAAVLAGAGGLALAALHRPLSLVAFDPGGANALAVRPGLVSLALLVLLAAAVATAVQGLGNLLVLAVLVAPAVAARRRSRSAAGAMAGAAAVAIVGGVTGVYVSFHVGGAAGACAALSLCVAAAAGAALPARTSPAAARSGATGGTQIRPRSSPG